MPQNKRYPTLVCTLELKCQRLSGSFLRHHHVPEVLGVVPVPWSSRWSWSLHLFLGRPIFLRPFIWYCGACFGVLYVSILCACCSHFSWYCFVSFTVSTCKPKWRNIFKEKKFLIKATLEMKLTGVSLCKTSVKYFCSKINQMHQCLEFILLE